MEGGCRAGGALLLLFAGPFGFSAQQSVGALEVRVRDAAGAPVAGTTVVAEPDAGPGRCACTTRDDGRCLMLAVAPGRYRVVATSSHGALVALVELPPGGHLVLNLAPVASTDGRATPPAALADATARATLGRDELTRLPAGRALLDALRVDRAQPSSGNWWRDRAPLAETRIYVEGIEWRAPPPRFQLGLRTEALGALRLEGPPQADARSGRGAADAISTVLRAGGSRLAGETWLSVEGWRLNAAARPFSRYSPWESDRAERGLTVPPTPWNDIAPAVSFGGPLGRPGLSFHASGAYSRRTRHRDVVFLEDPERLTRRFSWFSWSGQGSGNLTSAGRAGRRARLSLVFGRARNRGGAPALEPDQSRLPDGSATAGFTRAPFSNAGETLARWQQTGSDSRRFTLSSAVDWPIRPSWSISAGSALSASNSWTPPAFRGTDVRRVFATSNQKVPGVPPDAVHAAGYADHVSSHGTIRDASRRTSLNLEARWAPGRRTSHLFSAGLRLDRQADDVYIGHAQPIIRLYWNRALPTSDGQRVTGRYGYYTVSRPGTIGQATGTTAAAWLQDRWSPLDRLTLESGLRAEYEATPAYAGDGDAAAPVFGFGDKLAPRLSIDWRPDDAGAWRVQGSFGLFFDHLTPQLARTLFGARHDVRESWTLDTFDWRTLSCDEGLRDCPGRFIERVDAHPAWNSLDASLGAWFGRPTTRIDPRLRPMQTAEWGCGVERRLARRATLSVRYTGKSLVRALEDVGLSLPGIGEKAILANPGFGYAREVAPAWPAFPLPRAARRYHEVELELRSRGRPLSFTARYSWSRLTGNYGGLAAADEGGRESTNMTSAFDALYSSYDRHGRPTDGPLPGDRPHRLSVDATLALPFGTTLALAGLLESGRPESSLVTFRGVPVRFDGYGNLGRQPAFSQLDLQLRQELRAGGPTVTLEASVDNLFNQAAPLGYFSTNRYRDDLALPEAAFFDVPWDPAEWVSRLRAAGIRVRDEQLFLVPNRFQRPRRVTLTFRVEF